MHTQFTKFKSLFAAVAILALSVGAAMQASAQSIFDHNLVVNGGAEQGLYGWNVESAYDSNGHLFYFPLPISVQYGSTAAYPSSTSPGPTDRGDYLFVCQSSKYRDDQSGSWNGTTYQVIDVSAGATEIDAGTVQMLFSAWTGGWGNKFDSAYLTCFAKDVNGNVLNSGHVPYNITQTPSLPPLRNYQTGLIYRSGTFTLPAGTRTLEVNMQIGGQDASGGSPYPGTSAYVDNVSVVLSHP